LTATTIQTKNTKTTIVMKSFPSLVAFLTSFLLVQIGLLWLPANLSGHDSECTDSTAHYSPPYATQDDGSCQTCNDNDGIQNEDKTGVDCGGNNYSLCNTPCGSLSFIALNIASVATPTFVKAADLDGNGNLDVIAAKSAALVWFPNDGLGNFNSQENIYTSGASARGLDVSDLDGDGDSDILWGHSVGIAWYENNGVGGFGAMQFIASNSGIGLDELFAVDMDNDGDMDVLSQEHLSIVWYENEGAGNFSEEEIYVMSNSNPNINPSLVTFYHEDVDGDGDVDVIAGFQNNTIVWYLNDGNGNFVVGEVINTTESLFTSLHASDLDGDGDLDVLFASSVNQIIAWFENDGTGGFGDQQLIASSAGIPNAIVSDLDGDGDMDVLNAMFLYEDMLVWYENDGDGNFGGQQVISMDRANYVYLTDLDGDYDMDVLSTSTLENKIVWHENDCDPSTCGDGTQNGDETGIDCGGTNCPSCNTYYADTDMDTFGDSNNSVLAASAPNGYVSDNTDCDDTDADEYPDQVWYIDGDGDGYSLTEALYQCERPANGYILSELIGTDDCDDTDPNIYPGQFCSTCNDGIQNNNEMGVDCGGPICPPCTNNCTAPTNLSTNNTSGTTVTISWSAVPGAVEYFIQYIVQGAPLNTVSIGTTTITQVTLPGLLPSTTYQWRVRAICSDENSPYSDIASFTTSACSDMDGDGICDSQDDCPDLDDALIGSPCDDGDDCTENDVYGTDCNCAGQLIDTNANDICDLQENSCEAPVNLQAIDLTDDSATLTWDAVLGATEYQVQYLENGAPTSAVVSLTVTSNSVDITDLIFGSGYQWRVKAICPDGDTPWSETGEFLIGIAPCPKPANLLAQSQSATSATFSWDAVAEATAYRFQYRPIGGDGVSIDVPVSSSYTVNNLPVGATVQWRVRSLCDGENSGFEVGPSVTLSAPMPLVGGSNDSGFTLFPNPNDGQFTVSLPYREQGSTVVVRNAVGQTVYTAQTTETQLLIDLRGAYSASGLLFVTVQGEGRAPVTKRVLVSR
jgi:hypothetical protein